jgi:23S rRNA (guanosine2251-2'-O)-methyltransferase
MKEKKGNFWIWGLHSVLAAAEHCPESLSEIQYIESEISDASHRRLAALRANKSLQITAVPTLPRSLEEHRTQGIAANVKYFPMSNETDLQNALQVPSKGAQWILLDGIEDPRNFGAILRSAAAFGVSGVIVGEKFQAPVNGVVAQASAGTCFLTPIYEISSTLKLPDLVSGPEIMLIGLDGGGMDIQSKIGELRKTRPNIQIIWVLGAEGKGIHSRLKQKIENFVSIPMAEAVESLNASVAAGIVLYLGQNANSKT